MRRWIAVLLLVAMLPWQAIGWASAAVAGGHDDVRHAFAHWSGEAHHHDGHDDGFHLDDSDESIQHAVHSDAHLNAVALLPVAVDWAVSSLGLSAPDGLRPIGYPNPFLEGPHRPPRSDC
jgi:hypothetical protein